eukprot:gene14241-16371_t
MSQKSDNSDYKENTLNPILCVIGLAAVAGLAAVTAGLPLNLPKHQFFEDPASLDRGDTAWMMICTILGLFLAPALANYYGALYNERSTRTIQLVMLVGSVITITWILFTYSLCYGKDVGRFIGLPQTFYMFKNTYGEAATQIGASTIPSSIAAMYELGFALVAPAIITCSLSDRVNTFGFLLFIFVWHICVYCPLVHMMWTNQGWFQQNYIEDFSGGLVVHLLGAHTAFCAHFFLGRDKRAPLAVTRDASATLKAVFIVWFLWFGFSAGKAHSAGPVAAQSVVNVIAATLASVLSSFFYELIFERDITPVSVSTAVLLGLVGIAPASGYVTVGGAMVIGIATYLVTITVANQINHEGTESNVGISIETLHGVGGATGFLATAILSYKFINPDAFNGATWGNGWPILYHFILLCLFYVSTTVVNAIILFVCDKIVPLARTIPPEGEYPDFSIVTEEIEAQAAPVGTNGPAREGAKSMRSQRSQLTSLDRSQRLPSSTMGSNSFDPNFRSNTMRDLELTQSQTSF